MNYYHESFFQKYTKQTNSNHQSFSQTEKTPGLSVLGCKKFTRIHLSPHLEDPENVHIPKMVGSYNWWGQKDWIHDFRQLHKFWRPPRGFFFLTLKVPEAPWKCNEWIHKIRGPKSYFWLERWLFWVSMLVSGFFGVDICRFSHSGKASKVARNGWTNSVTPSDLLPK